MTWLNGVGNRKKSPSQVISKVKNGMLTTYLVPYELPRGNLAAYFPEANSLVPLHSTAKISNAHFEMDCFSPRLKHQRSGRRMTQRLPLTHPREQRVSSAMDRCCHFDAWAVVQHHRAVLAYSRIHGKRVSSGIVVHGSHGVSPFYSRSSGCLRPVQS